MDRGKPILDVEKKMKKVKSLKAQATSTKRHKKDIIKK